METSPAPVQWELTGRNNMAAATSASFRMDRELHDRSTLLNMTLNCSWSSFYRWRYQGPSLFWDYDAKRSRASFQTALRSHRLQRMCLRQLSYRCQSTVLCTHTTRILSFPARYVRDTKMRHRRSLFANKGPPCVFWLSAEVPLELRAPAFVRRSRSRAFTRYFWCFQRYFQ